MRGKGRKNESEREREINRYAKKEGRQIHRD